MRESVSEGCVPPNIVRRDVADLAMIRRIAEPIAREVSAPHIGFGMPTTGLLIDDFAAEVDFRRFVSQAVGIEQRSRIVAHPRLPILEPPVAGGPILLPTKREFPGRSGMRMLADVRESPSQYDGVVDLHKRITR